MQLTCKHSKIKQILIFIISITFVTSLAGCVSDVIHSGQNADYDPNNIKGIPDTYESRGIAVPKVMEFVPKDGYLGPACKITVIFNERMNREDVENNFKIYNSKDYPFTGKFIWGTILNTDKEYFDFIPEKELITDTYKVMVMEGTKSSANIDMAERFTSKFTFKPVPEKN